MTPLGVPLVLAATFLGGSLATAAAGWTPFATGKDSNAYGARATGDVANPGALAARVSKTADVRWSITCYGETTIVKPGQILSLSSSTATKCTVAADATTQQAGTIRVDLLRKR